MTPIRYHRILLKISGEMLAGSQAYGIDPEILTNLAQEIGEVVRMDVEVALVIGGGNIFRGIEASAFGMERASADYMGMLATMLNALALQNALEKLDIPTRVLSAIEMKQLAEGYIRRRAIRHLEKKRVVIFAAIKDPNITIKEILTDKITKLGENISIARFTRYQLGQE